MNLANRKAILYKRVSSDEQAERGYSLRDQEERLQHFCSMMHIQVVHLFDDDYSARTFDRPGWMKMMQFAKKNRGTANLLLFTNWSRFSRSENMGSTYHMIDELVRLGIEPQAIEQPLDLLIPENRLVLAFYIASPMVENMRRASNTTNGIHRSLKDGRWCNKAPWGYDNGKDAKGRPLLAVNPERAIVVSQIFTDFLAGVPSATIMKKARKSGFTVTSKSALQRTINNPLYGGLVRVFAWRGEDEHLKPAIHQPIIPTDVWYSANDKWKRDTEPRPRVAHDQLILRGLVECDSCGHRLTGSRSKGKTGGYWWYYRCLKCKGQNISATVAHANMRSILHEVSLQPEYVDELIQETDLQLRELLKQQEQEARALRIKLATLTNGLESMEEKYIRNEINFATYDRLYPTYRMQISSIRERVSELESDKENKLALYREALPKMTNMATLWDGCDTEAKQELIRLMFPRGLILIRMGYRTPYILSLFNATYVRSGLLSVQASTRRSGNNQIEDKCSPYAPEIEPLVRFILNVAA